MNLSKKFRMWGVKQCAEEIKVREADISFYCVRKHGHKGNHSIHMDDGEISYIKNRMEERIQEQKRLFKELEKKKK